MCEVYPLLKRQHGVDVASFTCENIYIKMPKTTVTRSGKPCTKMEYTRIAAVVGWLIKPDDKTTEHTDLVNPNEPIDDSDLATQIDGSVPLD